MEYYEIWSEGYVITGNKEKANWEATVKADTFQAACDYLYGSDENYSRERLTYWGCRLFDNEVEARKSFG